MSTNLRTKKIELFMFIFEYVGKVGLNTSICILGSWRIVAFIFIFENAATVALYYLYFYIKLSL